MPITLRTLTFNTSDILGAILASAPVTIRLTTSDQNTSGTVLSETQSYTTDASGNLSVSLIPNAPGTQGTQYLIKITHPDSGELVVHELITMPDSDADFTDLVGTVPPLGVNALLVTNNLSDVANAATARANLGLDDAYSSMWFHGGLTTITISTKNAFTKITVFANVGDEDASGNVVGDATTDDDFNINLAGVYTIDLQASFNNDGGGAAEFQIAPKIILNTAKTITGATNATPIVITSVGHGLLSGDGVIQSGIGGNTAANGDFYILYVTDDTYSLQTLEHVDAVGDGAYTSGGTVTAVIPGNIIMERIISNTDLGRGAAQGTYRLAVGDVVEAVVVNEDNTNNLRIEHIQFGVRRISN